MIYYTHLFLNVINKFSYYDKPLYRIHIFYVSMSCCIMLTEFIIQNECIYVCVCVHIIYMSIMIRTILNNGIS